MEDPFNQISFQKFRYFKWLYHCNKTEEIRMYEPWDGCVWIHSNRVLTYHLLHWQRAMMDNPIIFYYTVAPLPPPQKYTSQMSNIRYFTMKLSKSNIWQTSIVILLNCLMVCKTPHCYPFASKQQFDWSARHFSCCLL